MGIDMSVFDNSAKLAASWEGVLGTLRQHNQITAHRKRIAKQQGKKNANMASAHLCHHLVNENYR